MLYLDNRTVKTPEEPHFVYVLESRSLGVVKIGKSKDPEQRLRSIRRATGIQDLTIVRSMEYRSEKDAAEVERYLQRSLLVAHDCESHGGEWLSSSALGEIPDMVTHDEAHHWLFKNSKSYRDNFRSKWSQTHGRKILVRMK